MSELKQVRLTKSGKPDRRAETSRKNLDKGKKKVQEILDKAKGKGQVPYNPTLEERLKDGLGTAWSEPQGSFVEYETDEEEEFEIRAISKGDPLTNPTLEEPILQAQKPTIQEVKIEPQSATFQEVKETIQDGVEGGMPLSELKRILEEAELTKKEVLELKRVIKEQQHREQQRLNNEVQKELDRARQQAYGRLNSLSQQMSMKF
jgi:glutaminase